MSESLWTRQLEAFEIPSAIEGFADESADVEVAAEARAQLAKLVEIWEKGKTYGLTLLQAYQLRWPGKGASDVECRQYWRVKQQLHRARDKMSKRLRLCVYKGENQVCVGKEVYAAK